MRRAPTRCSLCGGLTSIGSAPSGQSCTKKPSRRLCQAQPWRTHLTCTPRWAWGAPPPTLRCGGGLAVVRRGDRGPGAAPPPPAFRLLPPLSLRLPRAARHLAKLLMRLGTMQTIARNMKELLSALRADPACLPQPGHQGAPRQGRRCRAVPRHPAGTCMCVGVMWPGLAAVMACYVSCSWYKLCIFVTKCHIVREAARVLPACFAGGPARCSVLSGRRGCAHCHQKSFTLSDRFHHCQHS